VVNSTSAWALSDNIAPLVGVGLGIPLLAVLVWSGFLLRRLRSSQAENTRAATRTKALLDAAPAGCLFWRHDPKPLAELSVEGMPRGFTLLGLDHLGLGADAFERISQQFESECRAPLGAALRALSQDGAPFDGKFRTLDARSLEMTGRREGAECVLWIAEVTTLENLRTDAKAKFNENADLQNMLDLLPLAVWWRDASLKIEGCNARYALALDATKDRVINGNWELAPDRREAGLARRAQLAGAAMSESAYVIIDGERRLFEFSEAPLSGDKEETDGGRRIGCYALDVTTLETVQSDLAEQIAAHDNVLESLGSGIAIFGQDKRLKFFNNAFLDLWRVGREYLLEEPLLGDVLEILRDRRQLPEYVDFSEFKREMSGLFTTLIEPREELLHLPDERTLRMLVTPHPMRGLMFVYEDVTDRLALERSYNTLIAVQNESLNNLHEAIAVFGADGRLKLWNDATTTMWGVDDPDALLETHIGDLIERTRTYFEPSSDWAAQKQRLILVITEPQSREGRLEHTDGSILDYKCVPLPDGGCLLGYIDVTDGFRVQRALEDRNAALEQADRMKSEFIATMSHELRTPLNAIIGFTEILDNRFFGELEPRQKEYVQGILAASRHLLSLINDILDLASVESGNMAIEIEAVDIRGMLNDLVDVFRSRAVPDEASLDVNCPVGIGDMAADRRRLRQALYNLVSNALQFTPSDGKVEISAWREDTEILFQISDSGVGIEPEDQDRVFEKFERTSRGGREGDAGLGLLLVKSIIEFHGGSVTIYSQGERGTSITCRIPDSPPVANSPTEITGANRPSLS
jgi:signal transduction histidine kinase